MATNEVENNYTIFKVVGDSMDNCSRRSFENGDTIFTKAFSVNEFKSTISTDLNSYWVIVTKERILFKQVTDFNETEGVRCHALNQSGFHLDIFIGFDDIQEIYRVMQKQAKTVCYAD